MRHKYTYKTNHTMKRHLLFLTALLLSISSFSQITIQQTDLMQAGDTFLIHVDINPSVTPDLTPGTDLTWDFSGLTDDQTSFATYSPNDDLEFIDDLHSHNSILMDLDLRMLDLEGVLLLKTGDI